MQALHLSGVDVVGTVAEVATELPVSAVDEDGSFEDVVSESGVVLEDLEAPVSSGRNIHVAKRSAHTCGTKSEDICSHPGQIDSNP